MIASTFNAALYETAAAVLPVLVLAAVVDLQRADAAPRRASQPPGLPDFVYGIFQLAVAAVGEVVAFRALALQHASSLVQTLVLISVASTGVILVTGILEKQAANSKPKRRLIVAVLAVILVVAISFIAQAL